MKNAICYGHLLLGCVFCVLLLFGNSTLSAQTVDLYLVAGQSNADGRAPSADLSASLSAPFPSVQVHINSGSFDLQPGLNRLNSPELFGPEVTFGRSLATQYPSRTIALVKYAVGSSDLKTGWKAPDINGNNAGPYYTGFMNEIQTAIASYSVGTTVNIRGMIWMQGESDANETLAKAEAYEQRLTDFINSVRKDLNDPNLPFSIGRIGTNWANSVTVRNAQLNVSKNLANTGLVETSDLTLLVDGAHYDAAGMITLGERFATSIIALPEP